MLMSNFAISVIGLVIMLLVSSAQAQKYYAMPGGWFIGTSDPGESCTQVCAGVSVSRPCHEESLRKFTTRIQFQQALDHFFAAPSYYTVDADNSCGNPKNIAPALTDIDGLRPFIYNGARSTCSASSPLAARICCCTSSVDGCTDPFVALTQLGETCSVDNECASLNCDEGICKQGTLALGAECFSPDSCASRACTFSTYTCVAGG